MADREPRENEYDSLNDVIEFQNNMFNPGHYIGTGKVAPIISATGNALPIAVVCLGFSLFWLVFGLFMFFSDKIYVAGISGISPQANKIIALIIMLVISAVLFLFGLRYMKKAKRYYRQKSEINAEKTDDTAEDKLLQRICPNCNKPHDIDYPKCPFCKYDYLQSAK